MAQASVDLPDPKQRPGSTSPGAAPTNVDDLLAQLAGEEIDRLLAEAETGRTPESAEPPRAESPAARPPSPVRTKPPTLDPVAQAASDPVDAAMSAQLDELFDQLESQKAPAATPAGPAAEAAAPVVTPTPEAPALIATAPAAEAVPAAGGHEAVNVAPPAEAAEAAPSVSFATAGELATTPAERVALELDLPEPSPAEVAPEEPTRLVRFLELLNAPLIAAPEALRALVGKIALVTLFNAVAVLVYVLIFRRHPH